ncbi:hypothetical protein KGA66_09320 [Actinocrinis puniceicyclus]|uniref:Uncharacterized protein n=1 Tax=Actinocrinis puniceicyclus TaxID=977794 RepID=A0A8J7WLY7_9ACTN|nr:hypothetical protein [Actinocrinis puniceicyclus]MBS2963245.1 hypothetical protein [Actinocrinis puniceicyclus]
MRTHGTTGSSRRRTFWIGAAAAVVLGLGSTALAAAATGGFDRTSAAAGCRPPALTGSVVRVTVTDMGSMMTDGTMMGGARFGDAGRMAVIDNPQAVPAGAVSLWVANVGMRAHEILVLPLAAGRGAGERAVGADGRVDESSSLGESSRSCAEGAGDGIAPGATGWVTLTLATGRYELLCNIPGHYAAGAYTELDVN